MRIIKLKKDGEWGVEFAYNAEIVQSLRSQPKRRFNPKTKSWIVTVKSMDAEKSFVILTKLYDWALPDRDLINQMAERVAGQAKTLEENTNGSEAMSSDFEVEGLKKVLYPFQKAGVEYIARNKRVLVGDQMGLGKTITTIAAIRHLDAFPAIVVVPNTLKRNWEREFNGWIDSEVIILNSDSDIGQALDHPFDVVICNYNTAVKYQKELAGYGFTTAVADESHFLKNAKAQRTKAFKAIAKKAEIVLELTGTAIVNRPKEILSQLEILGKIDEFGGSWKFLNHYCDGKRTRFGWDFSGHSNMEDLHGKLRAHCYVRREAEDVLTELPDLTRGVAELPITNRKEYRRAENDLLQYLKEFDYKEDVVAKWYKKEYKLDWVDATDEEKRDAYKLHKQNKVAGAASAEHLVQINHLKQLTAKGKMAGAIEWVENFLESGEKLVLFAHHTAFIKEFAAHFNAPYITGEVHADKRQDIIDDFQGNPETKLIILNLAVGGVGITLTAASHLAFLELGWTPGEHDQAEARIHRIGQKNHANIYYLLGEDTIDLKIFNLINEKRTVTDSINKGGEGIVDFKIMDRLMRELGVK